MVRDVRGAVAEADTGAKRFMVGWIVGLVPPLNGGASRSDDSKRIRMENQGFGGHGASHHHRVVPVRTLPLTTTEWIS